jgi:hypothetical protein
MNRQAEQAPRRIRGESELDRYLALKPDNLDSLGITDDRETARTEGQRGPGHARHRASPLIVASVNYFLTTHIADNIGPRDGVNVIVGAPGEVLCGRGGPGVIDKLFKRVSSLCRSSQPAYRLPMCRSRPDVTNKTYSIGRSQKIQENHSRCIC